MKQFDELRLLPGASIKLAVTAVDNKNYSLDTVYIGSLTLHSLIVAMPSIHPKIIWQPGLNVAATVVVETGIATFSSVVILLHTLPYGYLHLVYPKLIQFREIRGAARIKVELPAEVSNANQIVKNTHFRSRVLDISVSGLKLATDVDIGGIGDKLIIHITMHFAGTQRTVTVEGVIRACLGKPNTADVKTTDTVKISDINVYGVKFLPMGDESTVMLHAFVLNGLQAGGMLACKSN